MAQHYILVVKGKPEGPFAIDELKAMRIKPTDFVKTEAMDDYKEAHEIAELRAIFGFTMQTVTPQYFGSFDQRLAASVIDWLIVSAVVLIVTVICILFISDMMIRVGFSFIGVFVIPLVNLIYHVVMEGSRRQATYGKMLLKIRVCDEQGSDIDYGRAIGRNLAKILSTATFLVGYLFSFFTKRQQCLHDMIAGTLVMKDRLL